MNLNGPVVSGTLPGLFEVLAVEVVCRVASLVDSEVTVNGYHFVMVKVGGLEIEVLTG